MCFATALKEQYCSTCIAYPQHTVAYLQPQTIKAPKCTPLSCKCLERILLLSKYEEQNTGTFGAM